MKKRIIILVLAVSGLNVFAVESVHDAINYVLQEAKSYQDQLYQQSHLQAVYDDFKATVDTLNTCKSTFDEAVKIYEEAVKVVDYVGDPQALTAYLNSRFVHDDTITQALALADQAKNINVNDFNSVLNALDNIDAAVQRSAITEAALKDSQQQYQSASAVTDYYLTGAGNISDRLRELSYYDSQYNPQSGDLNNTVFAAYKASTWQANMFGQWANADLIHKAQVQKHMYADDLKNMMEEKSFQAEKSKEQQELDNIKNNRAFLEESRKKTWSDLGFPDPGSSTKFNYNAVTNLPALIESIKKEIYYLMLVIANIIFLIAVARNYKELGNHLGIHFIMYGMVVFFMIVIFPTVANKLKGSFDSWGENTRMQMDYMSSFLSSIRAKESTLNMVKEGICNLVYSAAMNTAGVIRSIVFKFTNYLFEILVTLSPLFLSFLMISETKSVGINFILTCFGFVLFPVMLLFGDILGIQIGIWLLAYTGLAASGAAASSVVATIASGGTATLAIGVGSAAAVAGFGVAWVIAISAIYIGLPWALISLLRGSGIGNALSSTMNTAANISSGMSNASRSGTSLGSVLGGIGRRKK